MARFLIVDDSCSIRRLIQSALESAGHEVVEAVDGRAALELARQGHFDVAITDIHMPHMDGLDLIEQLRQLPRFTHAPILVLTTEMDPRTKHEAKRRGATGWLEKPFSQAGLLRTVQRVLD